MNILKKEKKKVNQVVLKPYTSYSSFSQNCTHHILSQVHVSLSLSLSWDCKKLGLCLGLGLGLVPITKVLDSHHFWVI